MKSLFIGCVFFNNEEGLKTIIDLKKIVLTSYKKINEILQCWFNKLYISPFLKIKSIKLFYFR